MKLWGIPKSKSFIFVWWMVILGVAGGLAWYITTHPVAPYAGSFVVQVSPKKYEYGGGPTPSDSTVENSIYTGNGITFRILQGFQVDSDETWPPSEGNFFQILLYKGTTTVVIAGEDAGSRSCFYGLCNYPVDSQTNVNGITWDYLGATHYCDTECSDDAETYRATESNRRVYLLVYGGEGSDWLNEFSFTQ